MFCSEHEPKYLWQIFFRHITAKCQYAINLYDIFDKKTRSTDAYKTFTSELLLNDFNIDTLTASIMCTETGTIVSWYNLKNKVFDTYHKLLAILENAFTKINNTLTEFEYFGEINNAHKVITEHVIKHDLLDASMAWLLSLLLDSTFAHVMLKMYTINATVTVQRAFSKPALDFLKFYISTVSVGHIVAKINKRAYSIYTVHNTTEHERSSGLLGYSNLEFITFFNKIINCSGFTLL